MSSKVVNFHLLGMLMFLLVLVPMHDWMENGGRGVLVSLCRLTSDDEVRLMRHHPYEERGADRRALISPIYYTTVRQTIYIHTT